MGAAAGPKKSTAKVVLIVLAVRRRRAVVLGILAAIAIPVFLNQRAKAQAADLGLDAVTCEQVADDAVRISAAGQPQDADPLVAMTDATVIQDNRGSVRVPSANADPAFVMSCAGVGTRPDGTHGAGHGQPLHRLHRPAARRLRLGQVTRDRR